MRRRLQPMNMSRLWAVLLVLVGLGLWPIQPCHATHPGDGSQGKGATEAGTLQIVNQSLPDAKVGVPYDVEFKAKGGDGHYDWISYLPDGTQILPYGMGFGPDHNSLTGTALQPGSVTLNVTVADQSGGQASQNFTFTVEPAPPVVIQTATISCNADGSPAVAALTASGGGPNTTYLWTVVDGALPSGWYLGTDGTLSVDDPDDVGSGDYTFTVEAADYSGLSDLKTFGVTIPDPDAADEGAAPPASGGGLGAGVLSLGFRAHTAARQAHLRVALSKINENWPPSAATVAQWQQELAPALQAPVDQFG